MPVAIIGMHRSGTSLLAQMLNLSGLYLGPRERLLEARFDNPTGFWEHRDFYGLNDAVLAELGGGWDAPPAIPGHWDGDYRLHVHATHARQLLGEFAGREPWGWKDPRTSLTVSLWRELIPDLKVILCLRNPLEVAWSLQRRDQLTYSAAIRLWQLYNERALDTPSAQRIVVAYERVLADAEAELARVLRFLGISCCAPMLREAASACRPYLRHIRFGMSDLYAAQCHPDVVELYARLRAEAGMDGDNVDRPPGPHSPGRIVDERALEALVALQQVDRAPDDAQQISRIKLLVDDATAPGATVAVISKGDERLVDLQGRVALHFPATEEGAPLGYHPSSGRSAVSLLEAAAASGADYLLIPAPSLWWLEHYQELRQHLEARCRPLRWEPETAVLFDLRTSLEAASERL